MAKLVVVGFRVFGPRIQADLELRICDERLYPSSVTAVCPDDELDHGKVKKYPVSSAQSNSCQFNSQFAGAETARKCRTYFDSIWTDSRRFNQTITSNPKLDAMSYSTFGFAHLTAYTLAADKTMNKVSSETMVH